MNKQIPLPKYKFILDACCGPKLYWFNKEHPNTIFIDKREREKGFVENRPNREIKPDYIMDFRDLRFKDKSFKLISMDPPHLIGKEEGCRMTKTYGALNKETWKEDIKRGFEECWRVLEDYGVLIFKWSDSQISFKEILKVINKEPLFGQKTGGFKGKSRTIWFTFMKIPKEVKGCDSP